MRIPSLAEIRIVRELSLGEMKPEQLVSAGVARRYAIAKAVAML